MELQIDLELTSNYHKHIEFSGLCVVIIRRYLHKYICHIFIYMFVGVVNYYAVVQILNVVVVNSNEHYGNIYNFHYGKGQCAIIITIDWWQ